MRRIATIPLLLGVLRALLLLVCSAAAVQAQDEQQSPSSDQLEANPNRPSNSNSAEVLSPGIVQWEYGFSREWAGAGAHENEIVGEWRFGIWKNAEIRWGENPWLQDTASGVSHEGLGNEYFSGQYRFHEEKGYTPTVSASYTITFPTANEAAGLSSGRVDQTATVLVSKEIHKFTCDFNADYNLVGREGAPGHDANGTFYLTFEKEIHSKLSMIGEWGGETRLNADEGLSAGNLWALTYQIRPRVVLDGGIEIGITQGAPPKRAFFGVTYAVGNVYARRPMRR